MKDMIASVEMVFEEYPAETRLLSKQAWRSLFSEYDRVLAAFGANDFEVKHKGAGKSRTPTGPEQYVEIDQQVHSIHTVFYLTP